MRLHHAALISSTEANADQFYGQILQLKKLKTSYLTRELARGLFETDLECPFILYGNDACTIEIFVTDRFPDRQAPVTHLCLEVSDRKQFLRTCETYGVRITRVSKGESQVCFIQDFDGNRFEIKQS